MSAMSIDDDADIQQPIIDDPAEARRRALKLIEVHPSDASSLRQRLMLSSNHRGRPKMRKRKNSRRCIQPCKIKMLSSDSR